MGCVYSSESGDQPGYLAREWSPPAAPALQQYSVQCSLCNTGLQVAVPAGIAQTATMEATCPGCNQPVHFSTRHPRQPRGMRRTGGVTDWGNRSMDGARSKGVLQEALEQSKRAHLLMCLPREEYHSKHHGQVTECELCLGEYAEGDELLRLPCMHFFHCRCVLPWLQKADRCPICQTSISEAVGAN
mmetsp:Transcript_31813/g.73843  ORF Transcript_31813/g.73843 Transcript_31813/m.73843 type:complete len:187 (-) Transcript_31813:85-645(-)